MQGDGLDAHVKDPGVHDIDEPEFSILKQRVARRIVSEGLNVDKLDIAALTKVRKPCIDCNVASQQMWNCVMHIPSLVQY